MWELCDFGVDRELTPVREVAECRDKAQIEALHCLSDGLFLTGTTNGDVNLFRATVGDPQQEVPTYPT